MSTTARRKSETLCRLAALAAAAAALSAVIWKAAATPIAALEARGFLEYVEAPPLTPALGAGGGAQQAFYALLARWPIRIFGLSEFTLRLPSVVAAAVFFTAAFLIARRLYASRRFLPGIVALVSLNPVSVEAFSAASGEGLALALFACALWLVVRYVTEDYGRPERLLPYAGLLFGLAVGASLPLLIATSGVALAFWSVRRRFEFDRLWGPGVVPAFVLTALPLATGGAGPISCRGASSAALALVLLLVFVFGTGARLRKLRHWQLAVAGISVVAGAIALFGAAAARPYFFGWKEDAGSRLIAQALRDHARGAQVRIAASPSAVPAIRFYRRRWKLDWLPVQFAAPGSPDADYYVLGRADRGLVTKLGLRVLAQDALSGTVLARRGS